VDSFRDLHHQLIMPAFGLRASGKERCRCSSSNVVRCVGPGLRVILPSCMSLTSQSTRGSRAARVCATHRIVISRRLIEEGSGKRDVVGVMPNEDQGAGRARVDRMAHRDRVARRSMTTGNAPSSLSFSCTVDDDRRVDVHSPASRTRGGAG